MAERKVLTKLKARIIEVNSSRSHLAEKLEIETETFTKKLNGHIPFKIKEIEILKNELGIKDKDLLLYFF